ncbi:MAG: cytochrome C oxidase, partial [Halobacteriales archaeon]|nr:cytochrome C oxidase [Halobacteriales archaeon]
YATYTYAPGLQFGHLLTTGFAYLAGIGQIAFFVNMLWSIRNGEPLDDPWDDLFSGSDMPSPEWDGLPYRPPTPLAIQEARGIADGGEMAPDGGATTEQCPTADVAIEEVDDP